MKSSIREGKKIKEEKIGKQTTVIFRCFDFIMTYIPVMQKNMLNQAVLRVFQGG